MEGNVDHGKYSRELALVYSLQDLSEFKRKLELRRTSSSVLALFDLRTSQLQEIHGLLRAVQTGHCDVFWRWFHEESNKEGNKSKIFEEAVVQGMSFLYEFDIARFLEKHGISYGGYFRGDVETMILGKKGWNENDVMQQLDLRTGKSVKVYSEEMLLAFLGCGKDPFSGGEALLRYFSRNHSGLEFLREIGFRWPSTDVFPGTEHLPKPDWPELGILKYMGYSVGEYGKPLQCRREILKRVFETEELPLVESWGYREQWGPARSRTRLSKMAESIASFAKLRKRAVGFDKAIEDWETDLDWLKDTFYTGRFRFQWPNIWA